MAALTRELILQTAVAMADRDGFESVTLRRIAAGLEVHVTSLYNHVATREAVTDGIVDLLIDEAKLPVTAVGWEEWVRHFYAAMSTVAVAHPGGFTALQRRPVQGPRAAASFEVALEAFSSAGLRPADAYNAVKATALTALAVGVERSVAARGPLVETAIDELPAASFPQIRAVQALGDPEAVWSFTLETLVAGLRCQLANQVPEASPIGVSAP